MKVYEFDTLDMEARTDVLCEKGVYLGGRQELKYGIFLYQVDGFYVEIFYHQQLKKVTDFRCFTDTDLLEPYLKEINIDGIKN